jgi:hypothetical protein
VISRGECNDGWEDPEIYGHKWNLRLRNANTR